MIPDQLAKRFDRSVSWVSRRLALVELLPRGRYFLNHIRNHFRYERLAKLWAA